MLAVCSLVPQDSVTSNHASHNNRTPNTVSAVITIWRRRHPAKAVNAGARKNDVVAPSRMGEPVREQRTIAR